MRVVASVEITVIDTEPVTPEVEYSINTWWSLCAWERLRWFDGLRRGIIAAKGSSSACEM